MVTQSARQRALSFFTLDLLRGLLVGRRFSELAMNPYKMIITGTFTPNITRLGFMGAPPNYSETF